MNDELQPIFEKLGLAVVLGLLVGLQRQHAASPTAGVRTFPILTVLGTLSGLLDREYGASGWIVAAGLAAVGVLLVVSHAYQQRSPAADLGVTTEVASLLMFAVGAYLPGGEPLVAMVMAAGLAGLLQFKGELHGLIGRLSPEDVRAIMTFALIAGVVWPVLPNKTYGPFDVLNPFDTWRMVVLMVGLGLTGYLIYKFYGERAGVLLGGILGGAISSTATTFNSARRAAEAPSQSHSALVVILIASAVAYFRLIVEIAVVAPQQFLPLATPIIVLFGAGITTALIGWSQIRGDGVAATQHSNPTELTSALIFAGLYSGILFALAAAKHYAHPGGLYATAVLSGLTDMDAITLSTARLVQRSDAYGGLTPSEGWRLIVVASLANLSFKVALIGLVARGTLWKRAARLFLPYVVASAALWAWYP
jgi:uncharacterized membrane protein (DUF4010 family)